MRKVFLQQLLPLCLIFTFSLTLDACQNSTPTVNLPPPVTKEPTRTSSQPVTAEPAETLQPNLTPMKWWQGKVGQTWQWVLSDSVVDTSIKAEVYDIDLYAEQSVIDELHARGAKVICYISVGSWEEWRPDRDAFPAEVLGNDYDGWPGEKWLDVRQIKKLAPIMRARFDLCKQKGFDAIEPDNMEIHTNDTGFPLTYADQLKYALWLAEEAHARGLAIGQKNASDQTAELVTLYDFAITEDCYDQGWCAEMLPYIRARKPVFAAEYTDTGVDFDAACVWGRDNGFSFILKNRELDDWRQICP